MGDDLVTVSRADLAATLDHLDRASIATGGEPCRASFVERLRQALKPPAQTITLEPATSGDHAEGVR